MHEPNKKLESFLARHPAFGGRTDEWVGVPLEFRVCLAKELPDRAFIGSVRAVVLRGEEVLLVHSSVPILSVGGRCEANETLEQGLTREVAEETGWQVSILGVIGFIHCRHLDEQRPNWGRPAPDFVDPMFAVVAETFNAALKKPNELECEFVSVQKVKQLGVHEIDQTFLAEALKKRSEIRKNHL